jgi:hypothetical protein
VFCWGSVSDTLLWEVSKQQREQKVINALFFFSVVSRGVDYEWDVLLFGR